MSRPISVLRRPDRPLTPDPGFRADLASRLAEPIDLATPVADHVADTRPPSRRFRPIWAAAPAALLVIVAVGLPGLLNSRTPPTTEPVISGPPPGLAITQGDGSWSQSVHEFQRMQFGMSTIADRWLFYWGGRPDAFGRLTPDGLLVDLETGEPQAIIGAPIAARTSAATVWSGTEFIVFGGHNPDEALVDGAAFDPRTGDWQALAPSPFTAAKSPAAIWLSGQMLVWLPADSSDYTSLPEPTFGQVAIYDPSTDTWESIDSPPFEAVDAAWVNGPDGPILIGGPPMQDVGVVSQPQPIQMATLNMESLTWERGPDGPDAEAGRAFMAPGGLLTLLLDNGSILSLHGSEWVERTRLPGACWWDPAVSQGGGRTYLRYCELFETGTVHLGDTNFDRPQETPILAFGADSSGRLVVLTDAEDRPGVSDRVRVSIYDPNSPPESKDPGLEPSVTEFAIPEPVPLRIIAVRPGPASLAVVDLSQRTTTLYPPGVNDVPLTFPTDAAAIAPGGEILVWHGTNAYLFRASLTRLDLQIPLQGNRSGHQEMRALPSLSGDSVWLFAPGSDLGES